MKMLIRTLRVGLLEANCIILACMDTRKGIVIDPGGDEELITETIKEEQLTIEYIINTHAHIDHIYANQPVRDATNAKIAQHISDLPTLNDPGKNLSAYCVSSFKPVQPDVLLRDGDQITFGNSYLRVIHTPGHTPGSICLLAGEHLFSGDTLFRESIGRSDLPGGSMETLLVSITNKLMSLPGHIVVYPGHGEQTTIDHEQESNPFLKSTVPW